jgi:hypothetical protein
VRAQCRIKSIRINYLRIAEPSQQLLPYLVRQMLLLKVIKEAVKPTAMTFTRFSIQLFPKNRPTVWDGSFHRLS